MNACAIDANESGSWREISTNDAKSVLALAAGAGARPIDVVIDRLVEDDADAWIESIKKNEGLDHSDLSYSSLITGAGASVDRIDALKNWCKSAVAAAPRDAPQLESTLLYFLALSSALAHHGQLISSRRLGEVVEALEDLAPLLPDGERALIARAIGRTSELDVP